MFASSNANASVRGLVIDATSNAVQGVECQPASGTATLLLENVSAKVNTAALAAALVVQQQCQIEIDESDFVGYIAFGENSASVVDRTRFDGNWSVYNNSSTAGIQLDVTNSVLVDPAMAPSLTNNPTPGAIRVYFAYNTFYSTTNSFTAVCTSASVPATDLTFIDNVFYGPNSTNAFSASTGCIADTNIVYPHAAAANPGSNPITQDPKLVDAANGDFHLQAGSPAIDAAKPTANDPIVDLDGTTRPQGAADDIGAYEYKP